jgi:hypothetical protein
MVSICRDTINRRPEHVRFLTWRAPPTQFASTIENHMADVLNPYWIARLTHCAINPLASNTTVAKPAVTSRIDGLRFFARNGAAMKQCAINLSICLVFRRTAAGGPPLVAWTGLRALCSLPAPLLAISVPHPTSKAPRFWKRDLLYIWHLGARRAGGLDQVGGVVQEEIDAIMDARRLSS